MVAVEGPGGRVGPPPAVDNDLGVVKGHSCDERTENAFLIRGFSESQLQRSSELQRLFVSLRSTLGMTEPKFHAPSTVFSQRGEQKRNEFEFESTMRVQLASSIYELQHPSHSQDIVFVPM